MSRHGTTGETVDAVKRVSQFHGLHTDSLPWGAEENRRGVLALDLWRGEHPARIDETET